MNRFILLLIFILVYQNSFGQKIEYYESSNKIWVKTFYEKDSTISRVEEYSKNGTLVNLWEYSKDKKTKIQRYFDNGKIKMAETIDSTGFIINRLFLYSNGDTSYYGTDDLKNHVEYYPGKKIHYLQTSNGKDNNEIESWTYYKNGKLKYHSDASKFINIEIYRRKGTLRFLRKLYSSQISYSSTNCIYIDSIFNSNKNTRIFDESFYNRKGILIKRIINCEMTPVFEWHYYRSGFLKKHSAWNIFIYSYKRSEKHK